jgi:predicted nucleic acid-binding protein
LLDSIDTVALSRAVLDDAATLPPPLLRTLDAIHLAAAQRAGTALRGGGDIRRPNVSPA